MQTFTIQAKGKVIFITSFKDKRDEFTAEQLIQQWKMYSIISQKPKNSQREFELQKLALVWPMNSDKFAFRIHSSSS